MKAIALSLTVLLAAFAAPATAATFSIVAQVGDRDDFNDVDGDGIANLTTGSSVISPSFVTTIEALTDETLTAVSPATFSYLFTFAPVVAQAARVRIVHADVDLPGTGFDTAEVLFDGALTAHSLSLVPGLGNADAEVFFAEDVFTLTATQLMDLQDGAFTVALRIPIGGTANDGIRIDIAQLEIAPVPVPATGLLTFTAIATLLRRRSGSPSTAMTARSSRRRACRR
ncbi:MAG: hypothetical protein AAF092_12875 [Pseudomonadota bacterium]